MDSKEIILETLEFWKYKIKTNSCTMEELDRLAKLSEQELNIQATAEDLAKYFGTSESNVRHVLNRKVVDKPKRRVYYRFLPFLKNVPTKWLKNK